MWKRWRAANGSIAGKADEAGGKEGESRAIYRRGFRWGSELQGFAVATGEQIHIHFNEQVEQCIALEIDGDKDGELDSSSRKATSRASLSVDSKTIAILPSTTLKNEEYVLEPLETAVKHNNFFPGDYLEDHNTNMDWQSPNAFANSKDSMVVTQERLQNLQTPISSPSLNGNSLHIRHTPSDMFAPY